MVLNVFREKSVDEGEEFLNVFVWLNVFRDWGSLGKFVEWMGRFIIMNVSFVVGIVSGRFWCL